MKKQITAAFAITLIALGLTACGPTSRAPGTYESESTTYDSNGTKYEKDVKTDVTVDQYGNKKAVTKSKVTKDPKGLLNKSTTTKTTVEKE